MQLNLDSSGSIRVGINSGCQQLWENYGNEKIDFLCYLTISQSSKMMKNGGFYHTIHLTDRGHFLIFPISFFLWTGPSGIPTLWVNIYRWFIEGCGCGGRVFKTSSSPLGGRRFESRQVQSDMAGWLATRYLNNCTDYIVIDRDIVQAMHANTLSLVWQWMTSSKKLNPFFGIHMITRLGWYKSSQDCQRTSQRLWFSQLLNQWTVHSGQLVWQRGRPTITNQQ